jgi:hypothetical protein
VTTNIDVAVDLMLQHTTEALVDEKERDGWRGVKEIEIEAGDH